MSLPIRERCVPPLRQQVDNVAIEVEADEIELSIDRAVPLGLILNEAATNSVKHAFGEDGGRIIMGLQAGVGYGEARLTVADNGCGLGNPRPGGSGLKLVASLARQIGGRSSRRVLSTGHQFRSRFLSSASPRCPPADPASRRVRPSACDLTAGLSNMGTSHRACCAAPLIEPSRPRRRTIWGRQKITFKRGAEEFFARRAGERPPAERVQFPARARLLVPLRNPVQRPAFSLLSDAGDAAPTRRPQTQQGGAAARRTPKSAHGRGSQNTGRRPPCRVATSPNTRQAGAQGWPLSPSPTRTAASPKRKPSDALGLPSTRMMAGGKNRAPGAARIPAIRQRTKAGKVGARPRLQGPQQIDRRLRGKRPQPGKKNAEHRAHH